MFGIVAVVLVALAFDYTNGFHDAANSIATVVSTRVLSPRLAVLWAAFFNFIAFLVFGTVVAATIATGIADPAVAKGGLHVLIPSGLQKIGVFIILSPLLGLALSISLMIGIMWAVHR